MKLLAVFGTRPEAIKMAAVIQAIHHHQDFSIKICVTAQHRKMLDQVLDFFKITPDFDLDVMSFNQTLSHITEASLRGLAKIYADYQPDWVIIQGDTTTSFTAALAAFYQKIPVAHIEAGLRTHQIYSPWPEEINRQLTSRIARLHFAPTQHAAQNLIHEGIAHDRILVTGNTVIDTLLNTVQLIHSQKNLKLTLEKQFSFLNPQKKLILITSHRRENFGSLLPQLIQTLLLLAKREDIQIVYPVHPNPHVESPVRNLLNEVPNIFLLEPLNYLSFVYLMMQSYLILTDSGGVQEEAPSLKKPVLIVRKETERKEGVLEGGAKFIGRNPEEMLKNIEDLLDQPSLYKKMLIDKNPYGDGKAALRIVERLRHEC